MFVKLVKRADGPALSLGDGYAPGVCMSQPEFVYEADSVEFQKFAALGETEPLPDSYYGNDAIYMPFDFPRGAEYLDICLQKGKEWKHIIATGCTMYIMNDDGKTVDSVTCDIA